MADAAYYEKVRSTPEGVQKLREQSRRANAKYLSSPEVRERRRLAHKTPKAKLQARARKLRLKYDITIAQFEQMLRAQNYRCAICEVESSAVNGLHVDHDHLTNEVRALLCQRCNSAVGLFDDDPNRLEKAAAYLRKFGR